MATYAEAGKAQIALFNHLTKTFNSIANSPVTSLSVWYAQEDHSVPEQDFVVTAILKRQPTPEEAALLPKVSLGVEVRYKFGKPPKAGV